MKRKLKRVVPLVVLTVVLMLAAAPQPAAAYGAAHQNMIVKAIGLLIPLNGPLCLLELDSDCQMAMRDGSDYADNDTPEIGNPYRYYHYFDPDGHIGLLNHTSAGWCADYGFTKAKEAFFVIKNDILAWFWIGFVIHHIQDCTNPAHTDTFDGGWLYHLEYENECDQYWDSYLQGVTGPIFTFESWYANTYTHCNPSTAFGWVDYAAHQAAPYKFDCFCYYALDPDHRNEDYMHQIQRDLMQLAVRLSAGFMLFAYHTFYNSSDVDRDGITYLQEVEFGTLPWDNDTDDDIMPDGWEVKYKLNPLIKDSYLDGDKDGLSNRVECLKGTDPTKRDTDGDGMPDGFEVTYGLKPLSNDSYSDKDKDGVPNLIECQKAANPTKADTDSDGLTDYQEIYGINGFHSYPALWDSDGDGWSDYDEVMSSHDPLDPDDNPGTSPDPPPGPILDP